MGMFCVRKQKSYQNLTSICTLRPILEMALRLCLDNS
jgi:hypothetical protein